MEDNENPQANPPAPTVSPGGTARDFGNMLNYHKPSGFGKKRYFTNKAFNPWTKLKKKGGY